jgi:nitrate/TMAO reductase-like tetraheme cytochrome c subunit
MIHRRSAALVGLLSTSWPLAARAQEAFPSFQHDPVEQFGTRALTWSFALGLVLVACAFVLVWRGRALTAGGRALLLAAVVALPVFSLALGMLLVFERAERVEFCGSCHLTMASYVRDMKDPASGGLAALHYRNRYIHSNQCYECHTSYGLFGTVEAKWSGTIDVYRYYTGTYKLPITMRHKYPNGDCLKCHAESARWLAREIHSSPKVKPGLISGKISCMVCHAMKNPAHPIGP